MSNYSIKGHVDELEKERGKLQEAVRLNLETIEILNEELKGTCSIKVYDMLKEDNKELREANEEHINLLHAAEIQLKDSKSMYEDYRARTRELSKIDQSTGNTLWPLHGADLNALSWCLFFSVVIICGTVYQIVLLVI